MNTFSTPRPFARFFGPALLLCALFFVGCGEMLVSASPAPVSPDGPSTEVAAIPAPAAAVETPTRPQQPAAQTPAEAVSEPLPTLRDVNAVGVTLDTIMTFETTPRGEPSLEGCSPGQLCQIGGLKLYEDGTYEWRGEVGRSASERAYVCDRGTWSEGPQEVRLMSCGGSVYVADWEREADRVRQMDFIHIGEFTFVPATHREFAPDDEFTCAFQCLPFFDQRFR